jgi:uncharacterized protein
VNKSAEVNLQLPIHEKYKLQIERVKGDPIIASISAVLEKNLGSEFSYHSADHSDDVTGMAIALGSCDGLSEHKLLLLGIAAAYHDAGFIEQRTDHEVIGAGLSTTAMKADGRFSSDDINLVYRMILDTKLNPTGPSHSITTSLSPWLLDSDLANLGRADFLEQTELLATELQIPIESMLEESLALMNRHHWQSPSGNQNLNEQKKKNKEVLIRMLATSGKAKLS